MAYTVLALQNLAELKTRRGNATFPNAAWIASYDYPSSQGVTFFVWDDNSVATPDDTTIVQPTVGASNGRWIRDNFNNNIAGLAAVALSGSYTDLSNKPSIPAAQVQSDWTQATTGAVDFIKNKPVLSTVATSGSYNDLSNKPTIPNGVRLFGPSGEIAQTTKIWAAQLTPSTASGYTVDISTAGFSNIVSVQVSGQQNINTAQGALVSVKTDSNSQLTLNVYRSAVTGVLLLNTQVPGLELHPSPSSVILNITVIGY